VARYLLRRLLALGPTLVGVSLLAFLFLRLVPGDAIAVRLGTSTVLTPQQMGELRGYLGLDRPLPLQYLGWLGALLRGDAGYSLRTGSRCSPRSGAGSPSPWSSPWRRPSSP
jgi:peptide/nickel transport system permease protein